MYSPLARPLIVYSPASLVTPQFPPPALLVAHARTPSSPALVASSVTLPVIRPPTWSAALTPGVVVPTVIDRAVASDALALPFQYWAMYVEAENLTVYSPVASPVIVYSPLAFVVSQPTPTSPEAHTSAPLTAALVVLSVTFPEICAPTCSAALIPADVTPAVTGTGVASEGVSPPL